MRSAIPIVSGEARPLRQQASWHYDPSSGFIYGEEWAGADRQAMLALRNKCLEAGLPCDMTFERGLWHLRLEDPRQSWVEDTWELLLNEESVPALRNPRHTSPSSALYIPPAMLREIGDAYDGKHGDWDEIRQKYQEAMKSTTDCYAVALRLMDRLSRNETHVARSSAVLRHTSSVGDWTTRNVSDTNVDCIYTTAQLLAECANPNSWQKPLPTRLQTKILGLESAASAYPVEYYKWGWLKRGSTEQTAANNRIQITQEYWWGQWSTDEYASAAL